MPFWKLAARDVVFITLAVGLWWQLGHLSTGDGFVSDFTGLVLGLGLGACVFLLHEWGHLIGALATRSIVQPPRRLSSVYLFSYDSRRNRRGQFVVMSLGGFLVTGLSVWVAYGLLPDEQLASRVARGVVVLLTSLTLFLEIPLVIYALVRPKLPPVETFEVQRDPREAAA